MRIRRDNGDGSEIINISSLLDVMFILIIFFLVTTTFKDLEVDQSVSLPEESVGKPLGETEPVIVVNVRKSNAYLMMGKQVTIEEMSQIIKDAVAQNPGRKVLIRADQEALHGYVARAVAACRHAGIGEAHIGYDWKTD
jgi:biopolymer transport protein ExbD